MPVLSIIIPTFNAAATLGNAIQHLQMQTWQAFEIIIQDGNSTDDSITIAESFRSFFGSRLHIYNEADKGIYDAMNIAIKKASGDWIYFLGADDFLADDYVLANIKSHFDTGHHIVYGNVFFKNHQCLFGKETTIDTLLFEQNICHQAIFYHRMVFELVGNFNTRYPVWGDWEYNIRCFKDERIKTLYTDQLIAVFNDYQGKSKNGDPVFERELPVAINNHWASKYKELEDSPAYRLGKKWYPILKKIKDKLK